MNINIKCLKPLLIALFIANLGFGQNVKWIVKPEYDIILPLHEGVAAICEKGKWGYINQHGEVIAKPEYDKVYDFNEGMGVICTSDFQLMAIVTSSEIIPVSSGWKVDPRFAQFSDGLLLVSDGKKWGYLNKFGKIEIQCKYVAAQPFSEGLAAVTASSYGIGGWAYINTSGNGVILQDNNFTWASSFYKGKAVVIFSKQLALIDKQGKKVDGNLPKISSAMERYDTFKGELRCKEGIATFNGQGRLECVENQANEKQFFLITENKTQNSHVQSKKVGIKYGFIINGKETPCQFDEVSWFDNTTAIVKKGASFGVVTLDEKNPISVTLAESMIFSVLGNPAETTVVIKNLSPDVIYNFVLFYPEGHPHAIDKLLPNESKELILFVSKNSDAPTEEKELEIRVEIDGLIQNPAKIKAIVNDKPSLKIDFTQTTFEANLGEDIPVCFKITNISDFIADNLTIQVIDEAKIIYERKINTLIGNESATAQFNISTMVSLTKEFEIYAKPPLAPPIRLTKEIKLNVIEIQKDSPPPSKEGIDTKVKVL